MPGTGPRAVGWAFTIWPGNLNTGIPDLDAWETWARAHPWEGVKYLVFQQEKATTTEGIHIQGYIHFSQRKRAPQVNSALNMKPGQAVGQKAIANANDNRAYCTDDEKRVDGKSCFEFGVCPRGAGQRTDLEEMAEAISQRGLKRTMHDADLKMKTTYMKHRKGAEGLDEIEMAKRIPDERDVRVYVAFGPAGSGKSHWAMHFDSRDDTFVLPDPGKDDAWFDKYAGERTLVIEEMEPNMIRCNTMKRICDKYRYMPKVKGSYTTAGWDRVIITTNYHPNSWYDDKTDPWGTPVGPMQRRITQLVEFTGFYESGTAKFRTDSNPDWRPVEQLGGRVQEEAAQRQIWADAMQPIIDALDGQLNAAASDSADCAHSTRDEAEADEALRALYEMEEDWYDAFNAGIRSFNSEGTDVDQDLFGELAESEPEGTDL